MVTLTAHIPRHFERHKTIKKVAKLRIEMSSASYVRRNSGKTVSFNKRSFAKRGEILQI